MSDHIADRSGPTDEVGDEGGGNGDVERDPEKVTTEGSEATSTIASTATRIREQRRADRDEASDVRD